jgi:hypothetical protein
MAKCSYCNSIIVIGGVSEGALRFCNQQCQLSGRLLSAAKLVPDEAVRKRVLEIHQGPCPKCRRSGPVDIYTSHSIWSALIVTIWRSSPQVSCAPCGRKAKAFAAVGASLLGWWGFPWGLILTPIQVTRNLWGFIVTRPTMIPSAQLEKIARLSLAAESQQAQTNPPPVLEDPDKEAIDRLFPQAMKVGDPFEVGAGPMKGNGQCLRRRLTPKQGVLFTIRYSDGVIREWEWFPW